MSKIIALHAENFKRLKAVRIQLDGKSTQITGRNAQGKTSVLGAIMAALGGAEHVPGKPIRKGQDAAEVKVDLGDIVVTRRFSGERSTLTVEAKDGASYKSPQAVLDKLVGRLMFSPLAFMRMPAAEQAKTLRQLVGLDVSMIDVDRLKAYNERSDVNREIKAMTGALAKMPVAPSDTPDEMIKVADLSAQLVSANEHNRALRQIGHETTQRDREAEQKAASAKALVVRLHRELDAAESARNEADSYAADARTARDQALEKCRTDVIDVRQIEEKLFASDATNAAVRLKRDRTAKAAQLDELHQSAAKLAAAIEACDAQKAAALAAVKFPIPGLAVDGDTVTMGGLPLDQASAAEQLRACLAIGGALNPKLRTIMIEDGSLLDADGLALVDAWATENDIQVIMERVAGDKAVGVVIEDGEVAS